MEKEVYLNTLLEIEACIGQIKSQNEKFPAATIQQQQDNQELRRELERDIMETRGRILETENQVEGLITSQLQQDYTKCSQQDMSRVQYAIH